VGTLRFEIAPEVLRRFPDVAVYAVRARGLACALAAADAAEVLADAVGSVAAYGQAVADHPAIAAWRKVYASMGAKPSRYRSSVEALARRAAKGGDLRSSIPVVDFYNACSLLAWAPVGAYDLTRLPDGAIQLREAKPGIDRFEPLGADSASYTLTAGLIVYAVGEEALCWGFNVRDSRAAALHEASDDVVFFSEAVLLEQRERSREALRQIGQLLSARGATCSFLAEASSERPWFSLPSD
jgi:DNA/RNA-binding domain of Phe-tRNA-synthetase-like protein